MIETLFACLVIYFAVAYIVFPIACGLVALYETVRDHVRVSKARQEARKPGRDSGRL